MKPLRGRVAAIAGATGTTGVDIARRLAADGASVVLGCRHRLDAARQLAEDIAAHAGEALVLPGDVATATGAEEWIGRAVGWRGRLDILVNTVGDVQTAGVLDLAPAHWERMMSSNLYSAYYLARAAAAWMRPARYGRIILFAYSDADHTFSRSRVVPYAIAKCGVLIVARSLARELAGDGITVNVISPGLVEDAAPAAEFQHLLHSVPAGRRATTAEIAEAVRFLADEDGAYISGTNLIISGGWQV